MSKQNKAPAPTMTTHTNSSGMPERNRAAHSANRDATNTTSGNSTISHGRPEEIPVGMNDGTGKSSPIRARHQHETGIRVMKHRSTALAFTLTFGLALPALAADEKTPARMGSGLLTFDTVPGWGLAPDGKSVIGQCHGSVVIDRDGNIYTSSHAGVFVFSPEGKVIRKFPGESYADIHDMKIREE